MRSGRAYLSKRMPQQGVGTFEPRELRHVFPPARIEDQPEPRPRRVTEPPPQLASDLEKNQWTVVSFSGVEAGGLTYDQASRLVNVLGNNGISGLCIITDIAALKID